MCEITHSPAFLAQENVRLAADNKSYERDLAASEAENDQWQKKLAETWAEVERLRVALRRLQAGLSPDAGYYSLHLHDAREIIEQALGEG